jgi:hypothetical protein
VSVTGVQSVLMLWLVLMLGSGQCSSVPAPLLAVEQRQQCTDWCRQVMQAFLYGGKERGQMTEDSRGPAWARCMSLPLCITIYLTVNDVPCQLQPRCWSQGALQPC